MKVLIDCDSSWNESINECAIQDDSDWRQRVKECINDLTKEAVGEVQQTITSQGWDHYTKRYLLHVDVKWQELRDVTLVPQTPPVSAQTPLAQSSCPVAGLTDSCSEEF
jgi:hypothetical protein